MRGDLLRVADHHFHDAGHPRRDAVQLLARLGIVKADDNALLHQLMEQLFRALRRLAAFLHDLVERRIGAHLDPHGHFRLLIRDDCVKNAVFRIGRKIRNTSAGLKGDSGRQREYLGSDCHRTFLL